MNDHSDDFEVSLARPLAGEDVALLNHDEPKPGGIQRMTLTLFISIASLLLAVGSVGLSAFIYWNGLAALQQAQTNTEVQNVKKLLNETITTAAEARYAEQVKFLEAVNAKLQSDLIRAESKKFEVEAGIGKNNLTLQQNTTANEEFQGALGDLFKNHVTPAIKCLYPDPGESPEMYKWRCDGKTMFPGLGGQPLNMNPNSNLLAPALGPVPGFAGGASSPKPR